MLANVPRIMTSWFPRREPYELNSFVFTPCSISHLPAGLAAGIDPAGEMWSVVIESPNFPSTRAPRIGRTPGGSSVMPSKKGGFFTYVDRASHSYRSPVGVGRERQLSSP